jgi:pimeloyl-ACP methyl ester carboxylesterase
VSEPERAFLYRQIASLAAPPPVVFSVLMRDTVVGDLELARLALPVLFLVGAEDDIFPPALIEAAAKRVGGAQLAVIPKAGHSPYFERPEAFNREVLRFLDRVAAANATGS